MGTRPFHSQPHAARVGARIAAAALTAAAALLSSVANAAPAPSQADAGAIILRQLSFFKVDDLDFGDIVASGTAGTVRLLPDGTRTTTGGVSLVGSTQQPARFAGLGTVNQQVLISVSSNSIQLTGPGAPMTVSLFEIGSTPTAILTTTPLRFSYRGGERAVQLSRWRHACGGREPDIGHLYRQLRHHAQLSVTARCRRKPLRVC